MMNRKPKAAVIGASGYTGQELVRLLARHPSLELAWVTSEQEQGASVGGTGLRYVEAEGVPLMEAALVFSCLPSGASAEWSRAARSAGAKVVDLSGDLRTPGSGAAYGVPELWREEIRCQGLVANPGCYPTGILLTVAPLVEAGLLDGKRPLVVDAASGVTGAGRSARRDLLFGEVSEDYRAYGVGNEHRHVPEIRVGLRRLAGADTPFVFTPHLLPIRRGILETFYLPVADGVEAGDVRAAAAARYAEEPTVEVYAEGLPALRDVVSRPVATMGFTDVRGVDGLVLGVTAFDNLLKGAASQALQNANLMCGFPELEGVPL